MDVIPEARLNLIIHHLKVGDLQEAHRYAADLKPLSPSEYVIKAVVHASLGQKTENAEHLNLAQQNFQLVGARCARSPGRPAARTRPGPARATDPRARRRRRRGSPSECDTIPGRQCMASCYFLLKQFDDVLVYLKSIKSFFPNDDDFNWNYGIACASVDDFAEAEQALLAVADDKYKEDIVYMTWLARCHICLNKPRLAWDIYLGMESSDHAFELLRLIGNECYAAGQFLYAARAFDILERFDSAPENWEGKRGACAGLFQQVIAGEESAECLVEVLSMLGSSSNQQSQFMSSVMQSWREESGLVHE